MKEIKVPEFKTYEEEAAFWDNLDTADYIEDDDKWFRFETPKPESPNHKSQIPKIFAH